MGKVLRCWLALMAVSVVMVACGGGGGSGSSGEGTPTASESSSNSNNPPATGTGATNPASDTPTTPTITQELKTITIQINLDDTTLPAPSLTGFQAISIQSQVTKVEVEVLINGVTFSTIQLTQDANSPLLYKGQIKIPVDATAELHARATDAAGTLLFEGSLKGVIAKEFNSPAIQIIMQRKVALEITPPFNSPPVIKGTLIGDASLAYGQQTTVTVDAEDPQDDPIHYSWEVTAAPDGVDKSSLLTQSDQQGALFTAPNVTGIYTLKVTISDPSAATASTQVVLYVSETGKDGTPNSGITLSDFPDCVDFGAGCVKPVDVGTLKYFQTIPDRKTINPNFGYTTSVGTKYYTATQLFNMGFKFNWSDTCGGNNFMGLDNLGNETLVDLSSAFVPTFVKSGLAPEVCQLNLTITNPDGLLQGYQTVMNFSDEQNNTSDPLDCDTDPSTLRPKIKLTCPDVMTAVPQIIQVEICDAQGDLDKISTSAGQVWGFNKKTTAGSISYANEGLYNDTFSIALTGGKASLKILLIPYDIYPSSSQLAKVGADGFIRAFVDETNWVQLNNVQLRLYVYDRSGNYSHDVHCTFAIDPNIDLNIPAGYFQ